MNDSMDTVCASILQAIKTIGVESMLEVPGTKAIAQVIGAQSEVAYPSKIYNGRCDLVLDHEGDDPIWIEVKFSWTFNTQSKSHIPNTKYGNHLFHSAVKDVNDKLMPLLELGHASAVFFVLVAFDSTTLPMPESDIERFKLEARITNTHWNQHQLEQWTDSRFADCHMRAYVWWRCRTSD